ncbi:hypothetical protein ACQ4M3_05505 [Leptolyngbya sp. AN03gr2]|uniref:hypothetical protein n=1 Tax=unclassified Leptolyngbya TaxID=2650499 RepID=UPI003D310288
MPLSSDDLSSVQSNIQEVGGEVARSGSQLFRDGVEAYARLRNQPQPLRIETNSQKAQPDPKTQLPYEYYKRGLYGSPIQIDLQTSRRALQHYSPQEVQQILNHSPQAQSITQQQGAESARRYIALVIQRAEANNRRQGIYPPQAGRFMQRQPTIKSPQR